MTLAKVLPFRRPAAAKSTREPANGAAEALRRVRKWQAEIDAGATRAQIARREGLSRARVTQLMRLLELPGDLQASLLDGSARLSVRAALERVALAAQQRTA